MRGAGSLAINHVNRLCAEQFCATRGGQLPTIAQWEWALRQPERPAPHKDTWELVRDAFPFAVFGDTPGSTVHGYFTELVAHPASRLEPQLRWNVDTEVANGHPAVSFRCVQELEAPAE